MRALTTGDDFENIKSWLETYLVSEKSFIPCKEELLYLKSKEDSKSKGIYFWFMQTDGYKAISDFDEIMPIKKTYPIHKSFNLLSGVHKSDYMRAYLLHYYGGGYHDIKHRDDSWQDCWSDWLFDENIWIYGRRENNRRAIGYPPNARHIQNHYNKLVTMGWVICKPNTTYTETLLHKIDDVLDKKYSELVAHPGYNSAGYYHENPFQMVEENNYPLRWLEILGEIYHPLMLQYTIHIKYGLPDAIKKKRYS